jgi:hypothetical protein
MNSAVRDLRQSPLPKAFLLLMSLSVASALGPPLCVYKTAGNVRSLAVAHDYVYIGKYPNGFEIVSVRDPARPKKISALNTRGAVVAVAVDGAFACISESDAGLRFIDVRDPVNPKLLSTWTSPNHWATWTITARSNVAYIESGLGHLGAIDMSDPANPFQSSTSAIDRVSDIVLRGTHAYVAGGDDFNIFDISNPTNLNPIAFSAPAGRSHYGSGCHGRLRLCRLQLGPLGYASP